MIARILFFALLCLVGQPINAQYVVSDFRSLDEWEVIASDGVVVRIVHDTGTYDKSLRIDIEFVAGSGYGGVRKKLDLDLPPNYQFSFEVKGNLPPNNFEFKLVDTTGDNVWWVNRRNFEFPRDWRNLRVKKRHLEFAWGPRRGEDLERVGWVEFIVASAEGGKGSVWLQNFLFEPRSAEGSTGTPTVTASSFLDMKSAPESVLDTLSSTVWKSARTPEKQWLEIDFGRPREYSGIVLEWEPGLRAQDFAVATSDDGKQWKEAFRTRNARSEKAYIPMFETESRFLRVNLLKSVGGKGYGIRNLTLKDEGVWNNQTDVFAAMAHDAPRGFFPRYFLNEQTYWTVIGVSGDEKEALINEEGMIETDKLGFSLEPFLSIDDKLLTWNDANISQSLQDEYLPIPSVHWKLEQIDLTVTAFADGEAGKSVLYAVYEVHNTSKRRITGNLFVALRPFQVLPPTQWLNITGGAANVRSIVRKGKTVVVNETKELVSLTPPNAFGVGEFAQGDITLFLRDAGLPRLVGVNRLSDGHHHGSAALEYAFDLAPGNGQRFILAVPFYRRKEVRAMLENARDAERFVETARSRATRFWKTKLNVMHIELPPSAQKLINTAKSTLAYILINRDGPAIQPGSRTYERAWIRDGSLTSSAMLKLGLRDEVRAYIDWYSQYQYPSGKVPCVVDRRGPDPVPEHDSHGQLIFAIAQYYRFTKDTGFVRSRWHNVVAAINYIQELRAQRMTERYKSEELRAYYGLVPESISHEGYSAKPMHSYWDNFFVLRGIKDAALLASVLGEHEYAERYRALAEEFRTDFFTSIKLAMRDQGIDYIPGCVELGDFDPTSTAIGIYPGGELARLPREALERTFERYYDFFERRRQSAIDWKEYTPYEIRVSVTFLHLGRKDRTHSMLEFFFGHQRPSAWNHWAEVVWRDPRHAAFIGDMPHTWVGSDYLSVLRSLFVHEEEAGDLMIGAGIPEEWIDTKEGVVVRDLPTYYGSLGYSMQKGSNENVVIRITGNISSNPTGFVIHSPRARPIQGVLVDGERLSKQEGTAVRLTTLPKELVFEY
jgi:hypothetical protein